MPAPSGQPAGRRCSLPLGITAGLGVAFVLSYLAALMPDPQGKHHYFEIMLPGAILGLVVGFVSQRWGTTARIAGAASAK